MAEAVTKLPVKTEEERPLPRKWHPFDWRSPFRRSVFDIEPLWRRELIWAATPAIDIVEQDKAYEVTAELPGMD